MRHMLGNLSPNYFERTKRYMMLRASQQGTDLTVSGTPPLSLPNSLGKPLKAWSVDVLPKQDLNGYDAPWPAGGGANKLDLEAYIASRTSDYSVDANGWVTINSMSQAGLYANSWPVGPFTNGSILIEIDASRTTATNVAIRAMLNGSAVAQSITTITNRSFDAISFNWSDEGQATVRVSVVDATSITRWSPYANLCPILGTDKLNLFVEESYDQSATPKAVLTLPQTVYTGTIGSEGGESRWGVQLLNGGTTFAGSGNQIYSALNTLAHTFDYTQKIICDKLPVFTRHDANAFKNADYGITGFADVGNRYPNNWIYIKIAGCTTTSEVSAWLADNNVTIVYEAVDSTPIAITTPTIPTPTGTATTWATAEDGTVDSMEVTYVGKA